MPINARRRHIIQEPVRLLEILSTGSLNVPIIIPIRNAIVTDS